MVFAIKDIRDLDIFLSHCKTTHNSSTVRGIFLAFIYLAKIEGKEVITLSRSWRLEKCLRKSMPSSPVLCVFQAWRC